MPNPIAYLALLIWPFVVYAMFRKMPPERAFIWAILGGYMFLPELTEFNLPMIPAFNKTSIPNIAALVMCVTLLKLRLAILPEGLLGRILLTGLIAAPVLSVFNNLEPMVFGVETSGRLTIQNFVVDPASRAPISGGFIPGMRIYDSLSVLASIGILILPFFLARQLLATEAALTELLRALVIAGLIYSLPILFEVRFSPQLHTWIYGFFQHSFDQMIRQGGFRPIVFMPHGLWLALFIVMTAVASVHFARHAAPSDRPRAVMIAAWLLLMGWLGRSLGPLLIMLILTAMVVLVKPRMQLRAALVMAAIAILYPLLRGAGLIPTERLVALATNRDPERGQSLWFRFYNEDQLLERASQKPLLGWGGWGRNHIYDPETGYMLSVSDGQWIITIGQWGWLGYLALFGLMCLPLLALWWRYRSLPESQVPPQAAVLALLLGANLIDLLPNATLVPLTWLIAGALLGHAELQHRRSQSATVEKLRQAVTRADLLPVAMTRKPVLKRSFL